MDFHIKEQKNLTDISDSTLQLSFKKLQLVDSWYNIKKYPELSKKLFSNYISVRLTSVKSDIREIYLSLFLLFRKHYLC